MHSYYSTKGITIMFRLIFVLVVGFIIFSIWQFLKKQQPRKDTNSDENVEPMVECAYCHVYVAQSASSRGTDGLWYCCPDHALRARS